MFMAVTYLDAATFQVTYQLKILTTALFAVILLGKRLTCMQWMSLVTLMLGVAFIQMPEKVADEGAVEQAPSKTPQTRRPIHHAPCRPCIFYSLSQTRIIALASALLVLSWLLLPVSPRVRLGVRRVCLPLTSSRKRKLTRVAFVRDTGFAGVYFEKVLKGETAGIWVLNVQLASYGILIALTGVFFSDGDTSASGGEKGRGRCCSTLHPLLHRFDATILLFLCQLSQFGKRAFSAATRRSLSSPSASR